MSWQASRWARDQRTGSQAAKAVLLVLAEQASADGSSCTLSTASIADRTEAARTTVIRALAALESLQLIDRRRRFNPTTGHRISDEIRVAMPDSLSPSDEPRGGQGPSDGLWPKSVSEGSKVRLSEDQSPSGGPHIDKGLEKGFEERERTSGERRATPIPEGFPDQRAVDREQLFLRTKGWDIDAALEAESFRGHALNAGRVGKDWSAAFHNWIIKAISFAKPSARIAPVVAQEAMPAAVPWRQRVKAFADPANRYWNTTDWGPAPGRDGCKAPADVVAEFIGDPTGKVIPIGRAAVA